MTAPELDANPTGYANDGLIVKDASEGSVSNELSFDSQYASSDQPYLQVAYEPRGMGDGSEFTNISTALTDWMNLGVNAGSGDLSVSARDLQVHGTGLSYDSTRSYNSLNP